MPQTGSMRIVDWACTYVMKQWTLKALIWKRLNLNMSAIGISIKAIQNCLIEKTHVM